VSEEQKEIMMLPVPVPTTRPTSREALDEMIEKLDSVFNDVRKRAFNSFLVRGEKFGSDLEDWFRAERELFRLPESEMKETETGFEIRAAVPGFKADELNVQVLPELIVIEAKSETPPPAKADNEKVHFSEFESKRLFRQYKLTAKVDVSSVQAVLESGILKVVAQKAKVEAPPKALQVPVQTEGAKAQPGAMAAAASR